jgi:hypothetical protein
MSDLAVLEVVGSEPEALLVCAILRDAGVPCMHRVTNLGSGAMDGLTMGGPREIVVQRDQLRLARRVVDEQRNGPPPSSDTGGGDLPAEAQVQAVATGPREAPELSGTGSRLSGPARRN